MVETEQLVSDENSSLSSRATDAHSGMASKKSALAQAIVANHGFISPLSSSILENISPNLVQNLHTSVSSAKVPLGQKASLQTEVAPGQKVLSPAVPVGQAENTNNNNKRSLPQGLFYVEDDKPSKRARVNNSLSPAYSRDNEMDLVYEDFAPHSRWQPSEELSSFVHTIRKPLTWFEQIALVKTFPSPNIDEAYTPVLDNYLKPLIQGLKSQDKP